MSENPYIFTARGDSFAEQVLEPSHRTPILVDFWASWCAPCRTLMPVLSDLIEDYNGAVLLAKVNTDEESALATQYGIRSLPTVKLFLRGEPVDEFMGVQPANLIRDMLDRHVARETDATVTRASGLLETDPAAAVTLLQQAYAEDSGNPRIMPALISAQIGAGAFDAAADNLKLLPIDQRDSDSARQLAARIFFGRLDADAPDLEKLEKAVQADPADCQARYMLAARAVNRSEYEPAMAQLLEIMRRDRKFGDDAGRLGLLKVFDLLGGSGELISRYRSLMSKALY